MPMEIDNKLVERRSSNEDLLVLLDVMTLMVSTPKLLIDFFHMTGYDLGKMDKPNQAGASSYDKVLVATEEIRTIYESVRENLPAKWVSLDAVKKGIELGKQLKDSYAKTSDIFKLAGEKDHIDLDWDAFLLQVSEQIILRTHQQLFPAALQTYILLDWVHPAKEPEKTTPEIDASGSVIRYPYRGVRFNKEGLDAFFDNPTKAMKNKYLPKNNNSLIAPSERDELLARLRDWLTSLHPSINAVYGYKDLDWLDISTKQQEQFAQTLSVWFPIGKRLEVALSVRRITRADGQSALEIGPSLFVTTTNGQIDRPAKPQDLQNVTFNTKQNWAWKMQFVGTLNAFTIGSDGISLPDSPGTLDLTVTGQRGGMEITDPNFKPAYLIGAEEGTRLEIGTFSVAAALSLAANRKDAAIELKVKNSGFYLIPSDGDGFLQKILPKEGVNFQFDLALGYSNARGVYLDGQVGGEIVIPANKKLGNFLVIESLQLGIRHLSNKKFMLYASLSGRVTLGPFLLTMDKTGLALLLSRPVPPEKPNMGALDADFDFKAPDGLGIELKAKVVTGGGYIYCNQEKGEYLGVAQLNIKNKINLKAFGILLTKLPNGKKGYSFLLMVSAEFPAIQLGLGFTLTGVGGLVGINRRVELDKLSAGLRTKQFDDVLFPKAPLENPYGLLNTINAIFPPAENQYVIGLMGQFGWGPKNLVTIELGLILEFPEPVRLILMGVLKAEVGKKIADKEVNVLKLQCNFFGLIDFEKKFIRFDAVLFESTLAGLKLAGDLALRIKYGANSDFVLTLGGFHPHFQPPALDLPADIRRLQIILRSGNPSLIVSAYVAITANTFQFGVAGVLKFEKWGVKIVGELSFDALFQFSPFRFEISVHFLLSASWKGYEFAAIELNGLIAGPSPWHIEGSLTLKVWIFEKTVHLDETWGDEDTKRLESVRIIPLLTADLNNAANWETKTGRTRVLTTIAQRKEGVKDPNLLIMHPNELLSVRQNTVPLGLKIDKFGERTPEGANKFSLELLGIDNKSAKPIKNHFAPAQFVNLTDEQKLHSASYELFDSGLGFEGLDDVLCSEFMSTAEVGYETKIMDIPTVTAKPSVKIKENPDFFAFGLRNNAVVNSVFGTRTAPAKVASPPLRERFTVADKVDLKAYESTHAWSETEALQKLREIERTRPRQKGKLMVVLND